MVEFGFMNDRIGGGGWLGFFKSLLFTEKGMVTNVTQLIIFLGIIYLIYRIGKVLQEDKK